MELNVIILFQAYPHSGNGAPAGGCLDAGYAPAAGRDWAALRNGGSSNAKPLNSLCGSPGAFRLL